MTLALVRDVTEYRNAEMELLRSQRLATLGQFTAGVAHDFNNLLMVISGGAGTLSEMLPEGHAGRAEANEVVEAVRRAASLTRQLLALGQKRDRTVVPLSLNEVVGGVESLLSRVLGNSIKIELRLDRSVDPVLADSDEIGQVILNLALNARAAMPHGGTLILTTESIRLEDDEAAGPGGQTLVAGSYVQLRVSDTGEGMDTATRERIFDPFFTTRRDGTGLGLATVLEIVERFGGTVFVRSEPGRGSEFRVILPSAADERAPFGGDEQSNAG